MGFHTRSYTINSLPFTLSLREKWATLMPVTFKADAILHLAHHAKSN